MSTEQPKTTVLGSYPAIDWFLRSPAQQALEDATAVVLKTRELADANLVVDDYRRVNPLTEAPPASGPIHDHGFTLSCVPISFV